MHIPDGFLSMPIAGLMYVFAGLILWLAFKRSKKVIGDKHIPFFAVIAAAVFGGQMLNFSLIALGGTSGHLLGAALAAILFGPYGAVIVLTLVLIVQALFFADGGVTVLGANIANMGIVGGFSAYLVFNLLKRKMKSIRVPAFIAAWFSVVLASLSCGIQLGLSGTIGLSKAVFAMLLVHSVIGIGEGLITVGVLEFIQKTRPDLLKLDKISPRVWFK